MLYMLNTLVIHFAVVKNSCKGGSFLGFPTWYEYLPGQTTHDGLCTPVLNSLNDIWLIAAAIIEILLRVAALVAVGFVIYGGARYITSQGESDGTTKARDTIVNALIGLAISVIAAPVVAYIAGHVQ